MEPIPSEVTIDVVQADPIPERKRAPAIAVVAEALAKMRQEYAALPVGDRTGTRGQRIARAYRTKGFEFWHLTGKHPPPVYADL